MAERAEIPFAGSTVIGLEAVHFAAIQRTVRLLFALAHTPTYQAALAPSADEVARHAPGNFGVFMGYDFHVTRDGPRLIEVNTNAGGALLNGLHTAALCDPARLACVCAELLSVDDLERDLVDTFRAEFAAAERTGRDGVDELRRIAIVDDAPEQQFLAPLCG
jgi:hypothetical protein